MASLPDIRTSAHILFRLLSKFSEVHNDYDSLIAGLQGYIDGLPRKVSEVKITTIVGNSDPSKPLGEARRFLDAYFGGMDLAARQAYFKEKYFGSSHEYDAVLANLKALDDGLRLRLKYSPTFIIIGLTNKNDAGVSDGLYHLTLSRDSNYDVAGQHGIPLGSPVTKSVHLTDETTKIHYFVDYPSLKPLNKAAADLLTPKPFLAPGAPGVVTLSRADVAKSMVRSEEPYAGPAYPAPNPGETLAEYVKRVGDGRPAREMINIRSFGKSLGLKGGRTIRRKKSKQSKRKGTLKRGVRRSH